MRLNETKKRRGLLTNAQRASLRVTAVGSTSTLVAQIQGFAVGVMQWRALVMIALFIFTTFFILLILLNHKWALLGIVEIHWG